MLGKLENLQKISLRMTGTKITGILASKFVQMVEQCLKLTSLQLEFRKLLINDFDLYKLCQSFSAKSSPLLSLDLDFRHNNISNEGL